MEKIKLAVTTTNSIYGDGSGAIGVAVDAGTGIVADGSRVTGQSGDPRVYPFAAGQVLFYGSRWAPDTKTDILVYNVASAGNTTTWTPGATIDQQTTWPNSVNGHGAVELDGFLYVVSWDEATVIKADPGNGYQVLATYNFKTQAGRPNTAQHAGAAIAAVGGKIYALFVSAADFMAMYNNNSGVDEAGYASSTLVELDASLANPRLCTTLGKNAFTLELNPADGKLYVACLGGSQRFGHGANPDSRLDAVNLAAMTSETKILGSDVPFLWYDGDMRSITFTQNYAYLLTGVFAGDFLTFTGQVFQFDINDVSPDGLYGIYENLYGQGSFFALLANDNNHVWLVRGTDVDLYGENEEGEALSRIDSKFATQINSFGPALYFNGAGLLIEEADAIALKAARGYVAPAFASHSPQAVEARKKFVEKAEKRQQLKDKIKSKKK